VELFRAECSEDLLFHMLLISAGTYSRPTYYVLGYFLYNFLDLVVIHVNLLHCLNEHHKVPV
jgi:hypothetical protein